MYFDNMASAEQSVRDGETWGILAMDGNFSKNLYDRIIEGDFNISYFLLWFLPWNSFLPWLVSEANIQFINLLKFGETFNLLSFQIKRK